MVLIVKYVFSSVVALVTHMFLLPLLLIFLLVFGLCVFSVVVVIFLSRVGGGFGLFEFLSVCIAVKMFLISYRMATII